jgi:branched-chain amino acid transport system permease protein
VAARSSKTFAFIGSTALIALSGAFLAYYTGRVSHDSFTLTFAISFVVMVIIGGLRSLSGVLLGRRSSPWLRSRWGTSTACRRPQAV